MMDPAPHPRPGAAGVGSGGGNPAGADHECTVVRHIDR